MQLDRFRKDAIISQVPILSNGCDGLSLSLKYLSASYEGAASRWPSLLVTRSYGRNEKNTRNEENPPPKKKKRLDELKPLETDGTSTSARLHVPPLDRLLDVHEQTIFSIAIQPTPGQNDLGHAWSAGFSYQRTSVLRHSVQNTNAPGSIRLEINPYSVLLMALLPVLLTSLAHRTGKTTLR